MYTYVGNENSRPDSFTPRRLARVMTAISAIPSGTRCSSRSWNSGIEMIAATPAEMDTATVRM
jgi:hypothetical protein